MKFRTRNLYPLLIAGLVVLVEPASLLAQDTGTELQSLRQRVTALEAKAENPLAGISSKGRPFIESADGKFKIELGSRLQIRYTWEAKDTNRGTTPPDRSYLELERARLSFRGHFFSPHLNYKIEADGHADGGGLGLTDAYLIYVDENEDTGYSWGVGAGQWKPFFGRQEKQSSSKQLLVDRSLANEYFNVDRNVGIWAEGRKELNTDEGAALNAIGYEVAITNGIDSVNVAPGANEIDNIPAIIGHIDFDILGNLGSDALSAGDLKRRETPGLTVGTSFLSDQNNGSGGVTATDAQYQLYQFAFDTVFKYMGFSVNGEYFGRFLNYEGDGFDAFYTHGGYIEAGYMITDELQIVGRTSGVWQSEAPAGSDGNATELGAGVNYFFFGHNLKLSSDLTYLDVPPTMLRSTETVQGATAAPSAFSSSSANLSAFQGILVRVQAQLNF